ncbi:MAG: hypothetical protein KA801_04690 [Syntrophorhabdaceae bacterium]|nr:hypothetical protein [Syntrophorhabdaceae bacterium]
MKKALWMVIVFGLLIGFEANIFAQDATDKKPEETRSNPVREQNASAASGAFDETAKQYLAKLRSIDKELVDAHRALANYNNPQRNQNLGLPMDEILTSDGGAREKFAEKQTLRNNIARTEDKIKSLQKDVENLKLDALKHYNGRMPKNMSDAWKSEEDFTAYLISKTK